MSWSVEDIKRYVKEIPDYPEPGISYKDVTPLIEDGEALHHAVNLMSGATRGIDYSMILCAEARGFVFGTALAYADHKGVILARKPNKLPRETISASPAFTNAHTGQRTGEDSPLTAVKHQGLERGQPMPYEQAIDEVGGWAPRFAGRVETDFEARAHHAGRRIFDLTFVRTPRD